MIKKITKKEHIISILKLNDEVLKEQILDPVNASVAEWVQVLEYNVEKNKFAIWGIIEGDKVTNYLVAVNTINPPLAKGVAIIYQNFDDLKDENGNLLVEEVIGNVIEWAKDLKAKEVSIFGLKTEKYSKLGFSLDKQVRYVKVLDKE